MDFCPLLSEDMGEIDPLVGPKTQMCAFNQTQTKSELVLFYLSDPFHQLSIAKAEKNVKDGCSHRI